MKYKKDSDHWVTIETNWSQKLWFELKHQKMCTNKTKKYRIWKLALIMKWIDIRFVNKSSEPILEWTPNEGIGATKERKFTKKIWHHKEVEPNVKYKTKGKINIFYIFFSSDAIKFVENEFTSGAQIHRE